MGCTSSAIPRSRQQSTSSLWVILGAMARGLKANIDNENRENSMVETKAGVCGCCGENEPERAGSGEDMVCTRWQPYDVHILPTHSADV
ncbi:hypothetical protein BD309DRAFT_945895 [Dichomitus squalens]|nr:hypothetical protein BD309DRAFT_945895 [Dichomitus squalens]